MQKMRYVRGDFRAAKLCSLKEAQFHRVGLVVIALPDEQRQARFETDERIVRVAAGPDSEQCEDQLQQHEAGQHGGRTEDEFLAQVSWGLVGAESDMDDVFQRRSAPVPIEYSRVNEQH